MQKRVNVRCARWMIRAVFTICDLDPRRLGITRVRGALLTQGPDSSFGEVHRGSCSEPIHMEDEGKDQENEEEDGRDK